MCYNLSWLVEKNIFGGELMPVKIRLTRVGAKKKPAYRIVVADSRTKRDGKIIALLGYYDPMRNPAEIKIKIDKAKQWLDRGAQPTDIVKILLKKYGGQEAFDQQIL